MEDWLDALPLRKREVICRRYGLREFTVETLMEMAASLQVTASAVRECVWIPVALPLVYPRYPSVPPMTRGFFTGSQTRTREKDGTLLHRHDLTILPFHWDIFAPALTGFDRRVTGTIGREGLGRAV